MALRLPTRLHSGQSTRLSTQQPQNLLLLYLHSAFQLSPLFVGHFVALAAIASALRGKAPRFRGKCSAVHLDPAQEQLPPKNNQPVQPR